MFDDDNPGAANPQKFVRKPPHSLCATRVTNAVYSIHAIKNRGSKLYDLLTDPMELPWLSPPTGLITIRAGRADAGKVGGQMAETGVNFTPPPRIVNFPLVRSEASATPPVSKDRRDEHDTVTSRDFGATGVSRVIETPICNLDCSMLLPFKGRLFPAASSACRMRRGYARQHRRSRRRK